MVGRSVLSPARGYVIGVISPLGRVRVEYVGSFCPLVPCSRWYCSGGFDIAIVRMYVVMGDDDINGR